MANEATERDEILIRYALGELHGGELRELESRMRADPALRREARELQQAFGLIGVDAAQEPPASLRARVLLEAAEEEPHSAPPPRRRRPGPWLAAGGALAASLLLAVGYDGWRLRRELDLLREATDMLNAPNVVLSFELQGVRGGAPGAYGKAILDLDAKRAALVVRELPAAPEGATYWLWAVLSDDEHVLCGRFDVGNADKVATQLAIPVRDYTKPVTQLLVTRELEPPGQRPRGPIVLQSS